MQILVYSTERRMDACLHLWSGMVMSDIFPSLAMMNRKKVRKKDREARHVPKSTLAGWPAKRYHLNSWTRNVDIAARSWVQERERMANSIGEATDRPHSQNGGGRHISNEI